MSSRATPAEAGQGLGPMARRGDNHWASCGYADEREGVECNADGVPASQFTTQLLGWVMRAHADTLSRWGDYDRRLGSSVIGIIDQLAAHAPSPAAGSKSYRSFLVRISCGTRRAPSMTAEKYPASFSFSCERISE